MGILLTKIKRLLDIIGASLTPLVSAEQILACALCQNATGTCPFYCELTPCVMDLLILNRLHFAGNDFMHRPIKFLIYQRYINKIRIQKLTFYIVLIEKKSLFLQRNFAQNLNIIPIMKKQLIDFVNVLPESFIKLLGYPTIKVYSDYLELYFDTSVTFHSFDGLSIDSDEFRFFAHDDVITFVYTFYLSDDAGNKD